MARDHENPGFSNALAFGVLAIVLFSFVLSLRPTTVIIPGANASFANLIDRWWDESFSDPKMRSKSFDERFGSPFEKFPMRIQSTIASISLGTLVTKISEPYYGEPLETAALVRKFPLIKRISVSSQLAAKDELYQRLFEGLYPVLVSEGTESNAKLLALDEPTNCSILGQTKEAQLVLCP